MSSDRGAKVTKTDDEWRNALTPEQYHVTRQHGTERAFSNPLNNEKRAGVFNCVCCVGAAVLLRHQVRVRHRLAGAFGRQSARTRSASTRTASVVRAALRLLRGMRRPSRPRLSRWPRLPARATA